MPQTFDQKRLNDIAFRDSTLNWFPGFQASTPVCAGPLTNHSNVDIYIWNWILKHVSSYQNKHTLRHLYQILYTARWVYHNTEVSIDKWTLGSLKLQQWPKKSCIFQIILHLERTDEPNSLGIFSMFAN